MNKLFKYISVSLIFSLIFILVACSNDSNENDVILITATGIDRSIIENYIYESSKADFGDLPYFINGAIALDDQIVFWYVEENQSVVVVIIKADGSIVHETRILTDEGTEVNSIGGLQITDEGNIDIVLAIIDDTASTEVFRNMYTIQGDLISSQSLSGIVRHQNFFHILNSVFTENGNLVLQVTDGSFDNIVLYIITGDGKTLGELQVTLNQSIFKLKDGRAVVLNGGGSSDFLRVINCSTGTWGESLPLPTSGARNVISAGVSEPYDVLINDGIQLIGYTFDTATQTPLLNWFETGVDAGNYRYIDVLSDGRFFTLFVDLLSPGSVKSDWFSEIFIFNEKERSDEENERTILTLGGLEIPDYIYMEVAKFNRENQNYQIEINEYGINGDWEGAVTRFSVEMIAGRGPDIVINNGLNPDYMINLYTLIDVDPDFDRTNFFPNVLNIMETPEGTLPFISSSFTIRSVFTKQEYVDRFNPFTYESLLKQLDETDCAETLGGDIWMTRESFMFSILLLSGDSFIDYTDNRANFDSEEFINVLEIVDRLPVRGDTFMSLGDEVARLYRGEQYLIFVPILIIDYIYEMQAVINDLVALGMPTSEGGRHAIALGHGISINAGSSNQEAAWSFIRQLLLPDADHELFLPLNVDVFEIFITEFTTPDLWDETIPEIGAVEGEERPRKSYHLNPETYLYAMTESDASAIREIIQSADIPVRGDRTVFFILQEEFENYFNGYHRSAADTARIIQNRVQTYLDEKG